MKATPSLLLLNVSPRGERSGSRKLADEYLTAWRAAHPDARIIVRDVGANPPPAVSEAWIAGAYTLPEQHSTASRDAIGVSDSFIDEVIGATEVVIATPIYNFNIPAALKLWIDQVVRPGRTFSIDATGYKGLLSGRTAKFLVSSGGDFRPGQPAAAMNFAEPYLRAVFGFIGFDRVEFVYAPNQSHAEADRAAALAEALINTRSLAAAV
ncbi:MAG TPA: NAD(P)H-dependent oxidoreductase [Opitutaceae bacterium]|nr:NAD(P)H-dependent oxidoreductase [Opitutaceae bacterium]